MVYCSILSGKPVARSFRRKMLGGYLPQKTVPRNCLGPCCLLRGSQNCKASWGGPAQGPRTGTHIWPSSFKYKTSPNSKLKTYQSQGQTNQKISFLCHLSQEYKTKLITSQNLTVLLSQTCVAHGNQPTIPFRNIHWHAELIGHKVSTRLWTNPGDLTQVPSSMESLSGPD